MNHARRVDQSQAANGLMQALATKHAGDVFVPECKNGPTQTGSHRRLDAWVLLKTWSPVTTIGYEVKASRSDWRRDDKLHEYMGLCHLLYVVAPKGVVPREELPNGVGLIEASGATGRLVTRQKAARREIDMPVSLLVYVLMCRAKIGAERMESIDRDDGQWKVLALREWVDKKDERRHLHYLISGKIREQFQAQEEALARTERRIQDLAHIEQRIVELGFDPGSHPHVWQVEQRLAKLTAVIDLGILGRLERTARDLEILRHELQEIRDPKRAGAELPA